MRRALLLAALLPLVACGGDDEPDGPVTLRLVTHDSFAVTESVLESFTEETGIEVEVVPSGDAGQVVNRSVLNADSPLGDVLFGVDNTFLTRALEADIFVPYESPRLREVDDRYELDESHRVTPVDHGEVCVNADKEAGEPPASFDELRERAGDLVVQNPATSSPGLAFLLATIAEYGEGGWQEWWRAVADDVEVTSDWETAYYSSFSGGAGEGQRPLVVSYASSPPAEVVFADPPVDDAPTAVVTSTCFEQIEMAGILRGTEHEEEARQLIDFLLSDTFQADIPLQMFVFPVVDDVELPEVFVEHAAVVDDPLSMTPAEIDEGRERWIDEWTAIVLG